MEKDLPLCSLSLFKEMKNYPDIKPYDKCLSCGNMYGYHILGKELNKNTKECRCWYELLTERQRLKEFDICLICSRSVSFHLKKNEILHLINEKTDDENDQIALIKLKTIVNNEQIEIDLKLIETIKSKYKKFYEDLLNNSIKTSEAKNIVKIIKCSIYSSTKNSVFIKTNIWFGSIIALGKGKNIVYKVCNSKTKEIYACKVFENEYDANYEIISAKIVEKSTYALQPIDSVFKINHISHIEKIETEQSAFLMPLITSPIIDFFKDGNGLRKEDFESRYGLPEFMSIQMVKAMLDLALVAKIEGFAMCDMKPQNCGFKENDIKIYDFGGMTKRGLNHPRESTELFIMDADKPDDIADLNTIAVSAAWSADAVIIDNRYSRKSLKELSLKRMKESTHIGWKIAYICTSNDKLEDCNELCKEEFHQFENKNHK